MPLDLSMRSQRPSADRLFLRDFTAGCKDITQRIRTDPIDGGTVEMWDFTNFQQRYKIPHSGESLITPVLFINHGEQFIAGVSGDADIRIWDTDSGAENKPAMTQSDPDTTGIALSPDQTLLAAGGGHQSAIQIWDLSSRKPMRPMIGFRNYIYDLPRATDWHPPGVRAYGYGTSRQEPELDRRYTGRLSHRVFPLAPTASPSRSLVPTVASGLSMFRLIIGGASRAESPIETFRPENGSSF
jgi:WD40 repeat protein